MRLPKEKIVFVVDLLPVGQVPGRGMIDFYPLEAEESIKRILAMDWERMIPGHPGRRAAASAPRRTSQDQLALPAGRVGGGEGRGARRQVLGRRPRRK